MNHLGDITKIKGCNAPVVDCIIGGSPCQDLSVAGKRAGLAGERSGLYMEQIRIIKEMRHKDELRGRTGESIRPRYMVWENVPGAFSSNQGKDFAAVIEEAIKVADPEAPNVPVPEKGWPTSGCFMGDTWSVAWRVLDAQFWGVPQRRRRIALVADFGGQSAPEILFIRKGVSRDLDESEQTRKATAGDAEDRSRADDRDGVPYTLKIRSGVEVDSGGNNVPAVTYPTEKYLFENHSQDSRYKGPLDVSPMLSAQLGTGGNNTPLVMEPVTLEPGIAQREGGHIYEGVSGTLRAKAGDNQMAVAHPICIEGNGSRPSHKGDGYSESETMYTLNATEHHAVCYNIGSYHSNAWKSDNPNSGVYEADKCKTLDALQCGYPGCNQGGTAVVEPAYCIGNGQVDQLGLSKKVGTLNCMHDQQAVLIPVEEPIVIDRAFFNQGQNAQYEPQYYEDGTVPTLVAKGPSAVATCRILNPDDSQGNQIADGVNGDVYPTLRGCGGAGYQQGYVLACVVDCRNATEYEEQTGALQSSACHNTNSNNVVRVRYIVRRLTPLECERLQGFPDGWTDIGEWVDSKGKKHKEADSPRYKALGNSIALPPWKWVLKRLCACYERDATMASLFDGIGGFPLIWEQLNGKGSCLWSSEIEEFPMAVTKLRFGGNDHED